MILLIFYCKISILNTFDILSVMHYIYHQYYKVNKIFLYNLSIKEIIIKKIKT